MYDSYETTRKVSGVRFQVSGRAAVPLIKLIKLIRLISQSTQSTVPKSVLRQHMILVSFPDQTGCPLAGGRARVKLQHNQSHSDMSQQLVGVALIRLSSSQAGHDYPPG